MHKDTTAGCGQRLKKLEAINKRLFCTCILSFMGRMWNYRSTLLSKTENKAKKNTLFDTTQRQNVMYLFWWSPTEKLVIRIPFSLVAYISERNVNLNNPSFCRRLVAALWRILLPLHLIWEASEITNTFILTNRTDVHYQVIESHDTAVHTIEGIDMCLGL